MRSDQRGDRQPRRRGNDDQYSRDKERERMMIETDRAARAHRAEYGAMSPNPDMLSPHIGHGPGSGHTSSTVVYPSRQSTGYQSFAIQRSPSPNPNPGGQIPPPVRFPSAIPTATKRYSLSDNPAERLPTPIAASQSTSMGKQKLSPSKKGPQTFAEMGFQSKPVTDEGCVIM